jgi:hypothetical protein
MTLSELARRTLERIANAALATVSSEGRPWNSPLYVAFDATLTFFWSSHKDAVHSMNIAANPQVLLVVFDSTAADQTGQAVYIRGMATELRDEASIKQGLECLANRKNQRAKPLTDFIGANPRRVYAMVPEAMWTNVVKEVDGHYFDERVPIGLALERDSA